MQLHDDAGAGDGEHFPALRHVEGGEIGDGLQAERLQLLRGGRADAPDFIERDGGIETLAGSRVAQIADAAELRALLCEEVCQLRLGFRVADANAGRNLGFYAR